MKVEQAYTLVNNITSEILGKSGVVAEDLSNIVDVGKEILDYTNGNLDNYVNKLVDQIGKMVFVNRKYAGRAPSVLMDAWEFGSICEKITMNSLPNAVENSAWKLENGKSYDQYVFNGPDVSAKFFNSKTTFELDMSFAKRQIVESLQNGTQLIAFFSMIETAIKNSLTVKNDGLVMRTINNMIAETLYHYNQTGDYSGVGDTRAYNLLALYKQENPTSTLTASNCLTDLSFLKFAAFEMSRVKGLMSTMSEKFNIGGKPRFTSDDKLHVVMLQDFYSRASIYMQSDTFHNEFTAFPAAETVSYWQGSGEDFSFNSVSKINVTHDAHTVETSGILGVMFDRDALGVTNQNDRVDTAYNAKAEFYNNFYKCDASFFNDVNENFVVFYVA